MTSLFVIRREAFATLRSAPIARAGGTSLQTGTLFSSGSTRTTTPDKSHCALFSRSFGSKGTRGARGLGWLTNYREGKGGRHLQGKWHKEKKPETVEYRAKWNDSIFALNQNEAVMANAMSKVEKPVPTHVYMDFYTSNWDKPRRIVIELAVAALPITCSNFVQLCESKYGPQGAIPGFSNTILHKIEKGVALCCGDVLQMNGDGGKCHPSVSELPNGYTFQDEGFLLSHSSGQPGILSMLSTGVDKNDSRFMITLNGMEHHLDGKFVAFGRVVDGLDTVVKELSTVFTKKGRPANEIKIVQCGALVSDSKEPVLQDGETGTASASSSA